MSRAATTFSGVPILASGPSFLVVNVARIGDTLLATPVMRAIRAAHPDARIDVLSHPKRAEIIAHLPFLNKVGGISKRSAWLRGRIGGTRYDYAIVHGFDESLVAYALRVAKRVVAFRQRDESLNRKLYRAVDVPAFQSAHSVPLALRLPGALDIPPVGGRLSYCVTAAERAWAAARLAADVPHTAFPLIGLQVASFPTKAYRDWPVASFAELAQRIGARWPRAHFVIYGGADDNARTAWLGGTLGARATVYAGRLTLRETAAIMSRTQLYVGVDTGPTHIMSAFDIPLVGLYHCYSPSRLIGALDHPCFYPVDHPRPYGCAVDVPMAEISVEMVFAAVQRALADPSLRAAAP